MHCPIPTYAILYDVPDRVTVYETSSQNLAQEACGHVQPPKVVCQHSGCPSLAHSAKTAPTSAESSVRMSTFGFSIAKRSKLQSTIESGTPCRFLYGFSERIFWARSITSGFGLTAAVSMFHVMRLSVNRQSNSSRDCGSTLRSSCVTDPEKYSQMLPDSSPTK